MYDQRDTALLTSVDTAVFVLFFNSNFQHAITEANRNTQPYSTCTLVHSKKARPLAYANTVCTETESEGTESETVHEYDTLGGRHVWSTLLNYKGIILLATRFALHADQYFFND